MAFPMGPALSFGEFVAKLKDEHGVSEAAPLKAIGPKGPMAFRVFERTIEGVTRRWIPQDLVDEAEILPPGYIRSVCAQLGVDPQEFGIAF